MAKPQTPHRNGRNAPTSGSEWRAAREQGEVKRLPSGLCVRLRPVDLLTLAMSGEIHDTLTPLVAQMVFRPQGAGEPLDELESALNLRRDHLPVINAVCRAAFAEPRIVDEPQADDEIGIADVPILDRLRVFAMVTQGADALRSFRDEPEPDVAAVPDGDEAEPATEQPAHA